MYLPYTDKFPEAVAIAGCVSGGALTSVVWSRSFRSRPAAAIFSAGLWIAALLPLSQPSLAAAFPSLQMTNVLRVSALLATLSVVFERPSVWLTPVALVGQGLLWALSDYVRESDFELAFLHLFWYGALIGALKLWVEAPTQPLLPHKRKWPRSFAFHDLCIFAATVPLAFLVTNLVFGRRIYNGDEVANTFQADVYAHLRAYAPIPPCPNMFENYWVFRHNGHAFSQYTPGWPLFMAPFSRLGIIYLAGPVMAGILAVGIARLSRRLAAGLGPTPECSQRIMTIAGVLGAASAMLGPSMLLNGASRFSHPMVCACFAWAVESLCEISEADVTRRRAWGYGLLLGSAAALGVATRPADGGTLGVGVFLYFVWAVVRRRVTWSAFIATALGFAVFGGLTLVILRLQLGHWFQTGYTIAGSIHPEAELRLSWPRPNELKYGIPLAMGSYCWWPAAPGLGIAGLVRALRGRERRVAFMLVTSALVFLGFYYFVEFGRGHDDGLGPRYRLPLVVLMAAGGAALLAPLLARLGTPKIALPMPRIKSMVPAAIACLALVYGTIAIAPLMYPVAEREYKYSTAPFRGVEKMGLKNAIVIIERGRSTADEWNLAQNQPMNPNPDVLFLSRHSAADEVCARKNFPGRVWYRAGRDETLVPWR
jgi:hypothetical protein